jgi:hypothetical protein
VKAEIYLTAKLLLALASMVIVVPNPAGLMITFFRFTTLGAMQLARLKFI